MLYNSVVILVQKGINGIQRSESCKIPYHQIPSGFWSKYVSSFECPTTFERYIGDENTRYLLLKIRLLCKICHAYENMANVYVGVSVQYHLTLQVPTNAIPPHTPIGGGVPRREVRVGHV